MARELLPYYNVSYGQGIEGFLNYTNGVMDNLLIPIFLFVFYGLSIYVFSKSEWKLGGVIAWTSFSFFILSMIAQTFVTFKQIVIFTFFVGIIVGVVMSYIENAKS